MSTKIHHLSFRQLILMHFDSYVVYHSYFILTSMSMKNADKNVK